MRHGSGRKQAALSEQLLLTIAEQLKLPLQQIARAAELALMNGTAPERHIAGAELRSDAHAPSSALRFGTRSSSHAAPSSGTTIHSPVNDLQSIQITADLAVQLLDNYLFGARLALEHDYSLAMEPVSVSSVLYDSGQQLDRLAKLYGVELELKVDGKFGPVMANRHGLQSAFVSLGSALIEALPNLQTKRLRLALGAHRSRYGIVAGVYSEVEQLTAEALRQGRKLYGHSRQPLSTLTHSSGAGIFVADAILQAMDSELTPTRHQRLYGLGAVLQASPQLQLV